MMRPRSLEQRVGRLQHTATQADLAGARGDIARLDAKPGRISVVTAIVTIVGLVTAAIALAPYLRHP